MRAVPLKLGVFLSITIFSVGLAENVDGFSSFVAPLQPAFPTGTDGRPISNDEAAGESGAHTNGADSKFKSFIEPLSPAFRVTEDGKLSEKMSPDFPMSTEKPKTPLQTDTTPAAQKSPYGWQLPHDDLVGVRLGMDFEKGADMLFARSDDWMELTKPPKIPDIRIAFSPKKNEVAVIVRGGDGEVAAVGRLLAKLDFDLPEIREELSLRFGVAISALVNSVNGIDEFRSLGAPMCQPAWGEFFEIFENRIKPIQEIEIPFPVPATRADGHCGPALVTRTGEIDGGVTLIMWLIAPEKLPKMEIGRLLDVSKIEF